VRRLQDNCTVLLNAVAKSKFYSACMSNCHMVVLAVRGLKLTNARVLLSDLYSLLLFMLILCTYLYSACVRKSSVVPLATGAYKRLE